MNERFVSQEKVEREKALSLYISAFEQGDFDAMDPILLQATLDPILNRMIMEVHDYFLAEDKVDLHIEKRDVVRALVFEHLALDVSDVDEDMAIPPLTVNDVIIKIQQDPSMNEQTKKEAQQVYAQLPQQHHPLPQKLSLKDVYHLFEQLGVSASTRLQKLFREKAIFLSMGHEQGMAQLAATRHQRRLYKQKNERWEQAKQQQQEKQQHEHKEE